MEDNDVISPLAAGHRRGSPLKNGDNDRWRGEGSGDEGEAAAAGLKRKAERMLEQGAEKKRRQDEREPGTWCERGKYSFLFPYKCCGVLSTYL
jgi:hypothetical protein